MRARGVALLLSVAGCGPVIPPPMFPAPVLPALPPPEDVPEAPPFDPCPGGDGVPGDYLDPCAPLFMLTPWLVEGLGPRLFPALCPTPAKQRLDCHHSPPPRP